MLSIILFVVVLLVAVAVISRRIIRIRSTILLGKPETLTGSRWTRWRTVLLVAFGQRKMFKRPIPALLHLLIYIGFLVINVEVLEFVVDGLTGQHRSFAPYLGGYYALLMNVFEVLAAGVLLACVLFLIRRNVIKVARFHSAEMKRWPILDGNLILVTEIVLMLAILTMNTADQVLQGQDPHYTATGTLLISSIAVPALKGIDSAVLITLERFAWWFHIVGILGFAVYITYSKHLHIFMAFVNTYYGKQEPLGYINNMPVVTREVKTMLGLAQADVARTTDAGRFGAKDVPDLGRHALIAAYACTECGRCTSECPANMTGKKLSPRKIMMDTRDRLEEVGRTLKRGPGINDGKSLLGDYITKEEINACTSCNACAEACPILINPLEIILELRRYTAMEESGSPASWNSMFQNIETNFAPWKFPASDRFNWANELIKPK